MAVCSRRTVRRKRNLRTPDKTENALLSTIWESLLFLGEGGFWMEIRGGKTERRERFLPYLTHTFNALQAMIEGHAQRETPMPQTRPPFRMLRRQSWLLPMLNATPSPPRHTPPFTPLSMAFLAPMSRRRRSHFVKGEIRSLDVLWCVDKNFRQEKQRSKAEKRRRKKKKKDSRFFVTFKIFSLLLFHAQGNKRTSRGYFISSCIFTFHPSSLMSLIKFLPRSSPASEKWIWAWGCQT